MREPPGRSGVDYDTHQAAKALDRKAYRAVTSKAAKADPDSMTTGQRWRFRRNVVIYLASEQGVPQRVLADVFDMPHSRIAAILKQFRDPDALDRVRRTTRPGIGG